MRRPTLVAGLAGAIVLILPASAGAAGVSVTGDAGQATPIPDGGSVQVRTMTPVLTPAFSEPEKRYTLIVTGPDGKSAGTDAVCASTSGAAPQTIRYAGNGAYGVRLVTWATDDIFCETTSTTQNFTLVIAASVSLTGPASPVFYRDPGGAPKNFSFSYDLNPGATAYQFTWAYGARFGAGGAITGEYPKEDFGERRQGGPTGKLESVVFPRAGVVSIVGAAEANDTRSPFSAPVTLKLIGPFDWSQTPGITGGTSAAPVIGGQVYEPGAIGKKVAVLLARGSGKFKALVTRTVPASRTISFKVKRPRGKYRLRYVFKGADLVAAGAWTQTLTVGRTSSRVGKPVRPGR
jgi:hypothetical protein